MSVCVCVVGRYSVCYSELHIMEIRQCARDIAVPRSRVKLNHVLLEGQPLSLCVYRNFVTLYHICFTAYAHIDGRTETPANNIQTMQYQMQTEIKLLNTHSGHRSLQSKSYMA